MMDSNFTVAVGTACDSGESMRTIATVLGASIALASPAYAKLVSVSETGRAPIQSQSRDVVAETERYCLTLAIYFEGGSTFEPEIGQRHIARVITERANIELMLIDPYWARFKFERAYKFAVPILNVTSMVDGYHPSSFASSLDSPYEFARQQGREIKSLDDYLMTLDAIFQKAVETDAVCLKTTLAYQRTEGNELIVNTTNNNPATGRVGAPSNWFDRAITMETASLQLFSDWSSRISSIGRPIAR